MATGGYDLKFASEVPDRLVCRICQLASRDPHLSVCCGHIFCKSCIENTKKSNHPACPICRDQQFPSVLNKQVDREVKSLTVHCSNNEEGCLWKGEARDFSVHAETCDFERVQCEYHGIGCMEKVRRKDMRTHSKECAEEHLALSIKKLRNLEQFVYQLSVSGLLGNVGENSIGGDWSMQLSRLSMMTATSGDQVCPVIVKVSEFASKKSNDELWYSNSFYSHDGGYRMCWKIYPAGAGAGKGTHMSVSLCLMKGPYDNNLKWPLGEKFEFTLLNQINNCDHYVSRTLNYGAREHISNSAAERVIVGDRSATGWGYQQFISHQQLFKFTSNCQYLKNDCIFLQVKKV